MKSQIQFKNLIDVSAAQAAIRYEKDTTCFTRSVTASKFNKPGDRLYIKISFYHYRDPHVKDKTVEAWESPYRGKTGSMLRRDPGGDAPYGLLGMDI